MPDDVDDDLRDVFQALYDGDEWEDWADDQDEQVVAVTRDAGRHSRAYLRAAIASLLVPPTKRQRIYASPAPTPGFVPTTSALPALDATLYAPFSPLPLLARLRTFSPRTYSPLLPSPLSPVALALAGWVNTARDGLQCASRGSKLGCSAAWGVGGLENLPERTRNEVVRRLAATLSTRHETGCGWRVLPSPTSLVDSLQRYVHPLVSSSLYPLARAVQVRSLGPIRPRWVSPLDDAQVDALAASLKRAAGDDHHELDPLALSLALFGWYPYDPARPADADHVEHATAPGTQAKTDILQCRLCTRRVGLWMFAEGEKVLNVHKEHLWWCPLIRDAWWEGSPLLVRSESEGVPRLGERPTKRWKKWIRNGTKTAASTSTPTPAPGAGTGTGTAITA